MIEREKLKKLIDELPEEVAIDIWQWCIDKFGESQIIEWIGQDKFDEITKPKL